MAKPNIVVTGSSTGIGLSLSKVFISNGCRVFGSVRKKEDAERIQNDLDEDFIPLLFDVTDQDAVQGQIEAVKEKIGNNGLSCLVNNAGIAVSGPLMHITGEELRKQFDVNVFGLFEVTKKFLPLLGASKPSPFPPGRIINISSVAGQLSMPFMGPYTASKHALEGLFNSFRRELMIYGIDVITVAPGPVKTPIWDKGLSDDIPEKYKDTDYNHILNRIIKQYRLEEAKALDVDEFSKQVYKIYSQKKPRTYYVLRNEKFVKWTLPRYFIPDRMLDRLIRKTLKM